MKWVKRKEMKRIQREEDSLTVLKLFAFIRAFFGVPKTDQSQCTTIQLRTIRPFAKLSGEMENTYSF